MKKNLQAGVVEAYMATMMENNFENDAIPASSDISSENYFV